MLGLRKKLIFYFLLGLLIGFGISSSVPLPSKIIDQTYTLDEDTKSFRTQHRVQINDYIEIDVEIPKSIKGLPAVTIYVTKVLEGDILFPVSIHDFISTSSVNVGLEDGEYMIVVFYYSLFYSYYGQSLEQDVEFNIEAYTHHNITSFIYDHFE